MNTSSFPEQAVGTHVNQAVNQSSSDHTLYSQSINGNKTHCIVKQLSHILPQVFAMDTDSKISVVPMPVDSEQQLKGDTTQVKPPSKAQPKTKGWAPNLTAKPPVTHKQVRTSCILYKSIIRNYISVCELVLFMIYILDWYKSFDYVILSNVVSPNGTRGSICTCSV